MSDGHNALKSKAEQESDDPNGHDPAEQLQEAGPDAGGTAGHGGSVKGGVRATDARSILGLDEEESSVEGEIITPDLDEEQARKAVDILVARASSKSWSGPMPDSEEMEKFQKLVPDAPERFFAIVESQTVAPSKRLDRLVDAQISEAEKGRTAAVGLMLVCIACAIVFFAVGNVVAGLTFIGVPVLGFLRELLPERGPAKGEPQGHSHNRSDRDNASEDE